MLQQLLSALLARRHDSRGQPRTPSPRKISTYPTAPVPPPVACQSQTTSAPGFQSTCSQPSARLNGDKGNPAARVASVEVQGFDFGNPYIGKNQDQSEVKDSLR